MNWQLVLITLNSRFCPVFYFSKMLESPPELEFTQTCCASVQEPRAPTIELLQRDKEALQQCLRREILLVEKLTAQLQIRALKHRRANSSEANTPQLLQVVQRLTQENSELLQERQLFTLEMAKAHATLTQANKQIQKLLRENASLKTPPKACRRTNSTISWRRTPSNTESLVDSSGVLLKRYASLKDQLLLAAVEHEGAVHKYLSSPSPTLKTGVSHWESRISKLESEKRCVEEALYRTSKRL